MPDFTRGAIVLEGDLPFGADFYYGIKSPVLPGLILQVMIRRMRNGNFRYHRARHDRAIQLTYRRSGTHRAGRRPHSGRTSERSEDHTLWFFAKRGKVMGPIVRWQQG